MLYKVLRQIIKKIKMDYFLIIYFIRQEKNRKQMKKLNYLISLNFYAIQGFETNNQKK